LSGFLVQILLPLYDRAGKRFGTKLYAEVTRELTERFGGVTAYSRAPAKGLWKSGRRGAQRDDIVVYEVMVKAVQSSWWSRYRAALERRFRQDELVVRAHAIRRL
jgi:hypothetical protein